MSDEAPKLTRGQFLKNIGKSALLVGFGAGGYRAWSSVTSSFAKDRPGEESGKQGPYYSMAIDIEKCIGCGLCVEACSKENNVPDGHFRTWIERYIVKKDGSVEITSPEGGIHGFPASEVADEDIEKAFFVPKLCNHCDQSPCTQVCPVGATFSTEEGAVVVDYDWCVGCRYCIQACPYGSRFWNPKKRTADKCTLCYHRITKGLLPACVEVCPTGARIFGDITDPESPISKFTRDNALLPLKQHLNTGAKVLYKGLSKEVV